MEISASNVKSTAFGGLFPIATAGAEGPEAEGEHRLDHRLDVLALAQAVLDDQRMQARHHRVLEAERGELGIGDVELAGLDAVGDDRGGDFAQRRLVPADHVPVLVDRGMHHRVHPAVGEAALADRAVAGADDAAELLLGAKARVGGDALAPPRSPRR